jgi:hypothetical protein
MTEQIPKTSTTEDNQYGNISHATSDQVLPKHFLNNLFIVFLLNRNVAILIFITTLNLSYLLACKTSNPSLISSFGTAATIFGFLLTLKHNFISDTKDIETAHDKIEGVAALKDQNWFKKPAVVLKVKEAVKDEYSGIVIIILSTTLAAYGQYIPLM